MPRIRINTSGTCITDSPLRTAFHGVVRISSSVSDTDVLTRISRNSTVVRPVDVTTSPSGSRSSGGPGVMKSAGRTISPVKNGSASHTRPTKKPAGIFDRMASASAAR